VETEWRLMEQFVLDQQHTVFGNDALLSAQPLTSESETPAEISAKFGTITYSKGTKIFKNSVKIVKIFVIAYHINLSLIKFLCLTINC
jgi:aminopeptidase N